jgi:hypothetical protein
MSSNDPQSATSLKILEEFSKRLNAHVRDLKEQGGFIETQRILIDDVKNGGMSNYKRKSLWPKNAVDHGTLSKAKPSETSAQFLMICSSSVNN